MGNMNKFIDLEELKALAKVMKEEGIYHLKSNSLDISINLRYNDTDNQNNLKAFQAAYLEANKEPEEKEELFYFDLPPGELETK